MHILAVDIGTGTQDVLLFDTSQEPENALKMVMPSPTALLAGRIRAATRAGEDILLTGVTMGGGPCAWATEEHLKTGRRAFATPDAARTFNDDLDEVVAMGVHVLGEEEAARLGGVRRLEMRDLDYGALAAAFRAFDVDLEVVDVLALAVFDHGAAPPGISDRLFRFGYLAERIGEGRGLTGFAFPAGEIPSSMTRLQALASSAPPGRPLMVMDTAPAAVLGALDDHVVATRDEVVIVNVGNMHTLAFHLRAGKIAGLLEHHTGLLDREQLEALLSELARGTISHDAVFQHHGHGALILEPGRSALDFVAVTGPRRGLLAGSPRLRPYLAVPHGDMMMAGCWGMVRACARVLPWTRDAIEGALGRSED